MPFPQHWTTTTTVAATTTTGIFEQKFLMLNNGSRPVAAAAPTSPTTLNPIPVKQLAQTNTIHFINGLVAEAGWMVCFGAIEDDKIT